MFIAAIIVSQFNNSPIAILTMFEDNRKRKEGWWAIANDFCKIRYYGQHRTSLPHWQAVPRYNYAWCCCVGCWEEPSLQTLLGRKSEPPSHYFLLLHGVVVLFLQELLSYRSGDKSRGCDDWWYRISYLIIPPPTNPWLLAYAGQSYQFQTCQQRTRYRKIVQHYMWN